MPQSMLSRLIPILICSTLNLYAQFTAGSLSGTVVDHSGAAVEGATITLQNLGTGLSEVKSTAADGAFLFPALSVGTYQLKVERAGLSTYIQKGITVAVGQAASVSIQLEVGTVNERIVVTADAAMVTTDTATVSELVDTKRMVDLPLDGRQAQTLVFLAPGAVNTTARYCANDGCQGGLYSRSGTLEVEQEASVNGGGTENVVYLLDGADHNDTYVNMNLPFPNPDAIQEFSLQSNNMSAEYGQGANVVDIVTKSGTNAFHGGAFEFIRNGDLNARNFFAPVQDPWKRHPAGGTVGGPIKKDQLIFFGTYQGTRISSVSASNIAFVPTQAERNGDFSAISTQLIDPSTKSPFPNNQIPESLFSPPAQFFLNHIPLPNGPNGQLTYSGAPARQSDDQFMPKIDWIKGKNQLSGRYFFSQFDAPPDYSLAEQNALTMSFGQHVRVQTVAVSDTYLFSPTLVLSSWFGWNAQTGGNVTGVAIRLSRRRSQPSEAARTSRVRRAHRYGLFHVFWSSSRSIQSWRQNVSRGRDAAAWRP